MRQPNIAAKFKFPKSGDFWYEKSGRLVELEPQQSTREVSVGQGFRRAFLFDRRKKVAVVLPGVTAFQKISQTMPTFYSRHDPQIAAVALLTVQPEKSRRYVWITFQTGSTQGHVTPYENRMGFDFAKTSNGMYKLILRETLPDGEYVFLIVKPGARGPDTLPFTVKTR